MKFETIDEQFVLIADSILDLLTNYGKPPKDFPKIQAALFKNWVFILLEIGSKKNMVGKMNELIVNLISQAMKKGIFNAKEIPIPEDLKKLYLDLLQDNRK